MAFTQSELDILEKAIASGVKRVKFSDREVEYNSVADMMKARDLIRRKLGLAGGRSIVAPDFSKGAK